MLSRLSTQPLTLQAGGQTFRRWNLEEEKLQDTLFTISLPFFPGGQEVSRASYLQILPMASLLLQMSPFPSS